MGAVELVRDRATEEPFPAEAKIPWRVRQAALERGLILRAGTSFVVACPPLVITEEEIDDLAGRLDEALTSVEHELGL